MDWKVEGKKLAAILAVFLACFYLPVGQPRFDGAVTEALELTKWYAREHVLLCLVPAFFIAGAIGVFVSQASVMKYLGPRANKVLAYGVAAVSGTILAVCSCTVLPLFAGIWRMGAGLGPATAFLYSGPAINVLAIILTARILGMELGIARAGAAVVFSVAIGATMHLIYRKDEAAKAEQAASAPEAEGARPLGQNALYFGAMVGILVFANWGKPTEFDFQMAETGAVRAAVLEDLPARGDAPARLRVEVTEGAEAGQIRELVRAEIREQAPAPGWSTTVWRHKWPLTASLAATLGVVLVRWFGYVWWQVLLVGAATAGLAWRFAHEPMIPFVAGAIGLSVLSAPRQDEAGQWFRSSWTFAKQILPLLLLGVLASGFLLGRPGHEGVIPNRWIEWAVGGNSLRANVLAAVVGAFMYFATLTEVPILQGLLGSGMGKGPALALLLAGPALSLPSMLVLRSVMGTHKTMVYVSLVIVMATASGLVYGSFF